MSIGNGVSHDACLPPLLLSSVPDFLYPRRISPPPPLPLLMSMLMATGGVIGDVLNGGLGMAGEVHQRRAAQHAYDGAWSIVGSEELTVEGGKEGEREEQARKEEMSERRW